jgi:FtsH-binding integral membrane protein
MLTKKYRTNPESQKSNKEKTNMKTIKSIYLILLASLILLVVGCENSQGGAAAGGGSALSLFSKLTLLLIIVGIVLFFVMHKINPKTKIAIWGLISVIGIISIIILQTIEIENAAKYILLIPCVALFLLGGIFTVLSVNQLNKNKSTSIKNSDNIDKLEKLVKLKEKGVLNEEEFIEQKNKILNNKS